MNWGENKENKKGREKWWRERGNKEKQKMVNSQDKLYWKSYSEKNCNIDVIKKI